MRIGDQWPRAGRSYFRGTLPVTKTLGPEPLRGAVHLRRVPGDR
jgi:hypothetical protein